VQLEFACLTALSQPSAQFACWQLNEVRALAAWGPDDHLQQQQSFNGNEIITRVDDSLSAEDFSRRRPSIQLLIRL